jgi:hypothetical protein
MFENLLIFILIILFFHWFADFVFQSDHMAKNKSKSIEILTYHVFIYTIFITVPFAVMSETLFDNIMIGTIIGLLNGVFHWITDFFTSRLSSKLYSKERIHDFFVVIGLDQYIHNICLILSVFYIFKFTNAF